MSFLRHVTSEMSSHFLHCYGFIMLKTNSWSFALWHFVRCICSETAGFVHVDRSEEPPQESSGGV